MEYTTTWGKSTKNYAFVHDKKDLSLNKQRYNTISFNVDISKTFEKKNFFELLITKWFTNGKSII